MVSFASSSPFWCRICSSPLPTSWLSSIASGCCLAIFTFLQWTSVSGGSSPVFLLPHSCFSFCPFISSVAMCALASVFAFSIVTLAFIALLHWSEDLVLQINLLQLRQPKFGPTVLSRSTPPSSILRGASAPPMASSTSAGSTSSIISASTIPT